MTKPLDVNEVDFEKEVIKVTDKLVLVDFWAPWCGPCRRLSPIIEDLANDYDGKMKVVKINSDDNVKLAQSCSVTGIPNLIFFKKGEAVERITGLVQKSTLVSTIDKLLS